MGESTYSNGYIWNADLVLKQIIQERGQTKVIFINGILTDSDGFNDQSNDVKTELKLRDWNDKTVEHGYSSLVLQSFHNPSKGPSAEILGFHDSLSKTIFSFAANNYNNYLKSQSSIANAIITAGISAIGDTYPPGIPGLETVQDLALELLPEEQKDNYAYKLALDISKPVSGVGKLLNLSQTEKNLLANFVDKFGKLEDLPNRIGTDASTDLMESLSQFFAVDPSPASKHVNNELNWSEQALDWLGQNNNNSVIFVPHSQGNFFVEDGLLDNKTNFQNLFGSRVKIISLGSPTDYSALSLDSDTLASFKNKIPFVDPVANLQVEARYSNKEKFQHLLNWLPEGLSGVVTTASGVAIGHDLGRYLGKDFLSVPGRKDVKPKFKEFAEALNPKGYYFPNSPTFGSGNIEGSNDSGDWLEGIWTSDTLDGKGKNDVLRGQGGNDRFIAGAGWDFIDGGTGTDSVDYGNWSNTITVRADNISGSDIYRVIKNAYGHEDILVHIETVYGSRFKDYMYGGRGKDVFHGNAGNDELWGEGYSSNFSDMQDPDKVPGSGDELHGDAGDDTLRGQGGNDKLYGGNDQDTLLGGVGNDLLDGGSGNDFLIGAQGYDTINGGSNIDTVRYLNSPKNVIVNLDEINPYLNRLNYRENVAINSANPRGYFYELEPDFQIGAGKAVDGFGTVDKLKNLENIIGSVNNDVLIGNQRNNIIKGYLGNDLIVNTAGYDLFDGGEGNDTVSLRRDPGDVVVNLTRNFAIDAWGGRDAIVNIENIVASDLGNDRLTGNNIANIITGGNGNDYIKGLGGNDTLHGEFGNDSIVGGLGKDSLVGNQGSDTIWGDAIGNPDAGDADLIRGGDGDDKIHAGGGDDTVFGDSGIGNDEIWGDAGNDKLHGGAGNDIIEGGTGNDLILGEDGADILRGNSGSDTVDGGKGTDLVDYVDSPSGVIVNINESQGYSSNQQNSFAPYRNYEIGAGAAKDGYGFSDSLRNLENIDGSEFADVLIGNNLNNEIRGKGDNDILVGLEGDDNLQGQDGDDVMLGGAGKDRINGGEGIDISSYRDATSSVSVSLNAGSGWQGDAAGDEIVETEGLEGSNFNDYLIGDKGKNILNGIGGDDTLEGYDGDDVINGGDGSDRLVGGLGNDTQIGGLGNDVHYGELGNDKLIDLAGDNYIDAGEGNNIVIAGDGSDFIYSGPGNDVINGGNGKNIIHAGEGKNQITTGSDNDIIYGGASKDIIFAGAGDDQIFAAEGNNIIRAGAGNDTIYAGAGYDSITGGLGDDLIFAGDGDNWINGGIGNDIINSGSGKDLFILDLSDGTDTINNFQIGHDLIGLSGGLTFEQLFVSQGTDDLNSSTLISDANSGDILASLSWTSADSINSSSFTII
ncbi:MAG: hypothetical protein KI793_29325 [Rivularia sp. (in: Bacteria)]|nr:hypothetical protein [Rivularia sp. MS3]